MKKITFVRTIEAYQHITMTINDEEKFREFCEEWIGQGQTLNFWDLDEITEPIITVDEADIQWDYSNEDHFYDAMWAEGFPTDEEQLGELQEQK
jgi:hypothetical protein